MFRVDRKKLNLIFLDLEKAYKVLRQWIWQTLKKKGIPNDNIEIIQDVHDGAVTSVQSVQDVVWVPSGNEIAPSVLFEPLFIALVMDNITADIQDEVLGVCCVQMVVQYPLVKLEGMKWNTRNGERNLSKLEWELADQRQYMEYKFSEFENWWLVKIEDNLVS